MLETLMIKSTDLFKVQGSKVNSNSNIVMNVFVQFVLAQGHTFESKCLNRNVALVSLVLRSNKSPNKVFSKTF